MKIVSAIVATALFASMFGTGVHQLPVYAFSITPPSAPSSLLEPSGVGPPSVIEETPAVIGTPPIPAEPAEGVVAYESAPPPEPDPPPPPPPSGISDNQLYRLRMCESTNNYAINTGNGFRGAYQYVQSTWNTAAADAGRPDLIGVPVNQVSPGDQDAVTRYWWDHASPHHEWPVCSYRVGAP